MKREKLHKCSNISIVVLFTFPNKVLSFIKTLWIFLALVISAWFTKVSISPWRRSPKIKFRQENRINWKRKKNNTRSKKIFKISLDTNLSFKKSSLRKIRNFLIQIQLKTCFIVRKKIKMKKKECKTAKIWVLLECLTKKLNQMKDNIILITRIFYLIRCIRVSHKALSSITWHCKNKDTKILCLISVKCRKIKWLKKNRNL